MAQIISATTRVGRRVSARDRHLFAARTSLDRARAHFSRNEAGLALENAYLAALRTAGARIAVSEVLAKRKRLPSSAWDKLALVDGAGCARAQEFSRYSAWRSRVGSGIERDPDVGLVGDLLARAEAFLAEVEADAGWRSSADDAA
ncbi:MAG: SAV_6107 family HEPN domain-containing protein [Corynebacterium sp.]|uniref:SAV_6107 family HEPN domain-containing protein n=1 Tax=Corynebacterium sp. TaxID=1720 RepID=UPI0026FD1EC6|nr:SAV_6107 family HEPN domain-containing protein [Corynebacterium sp.]